MERRVVAVWQELLGYREIGVHDNFYGLGGDSLLATDVVADLRAKFDLELPMKRVFEAVDEPVVVIGMSLPLPRRPRTGRVLAAADGRPGCGHRGAGGSLGRR